MNAEQLLEHAASVVTHRRGIYGPPVDRALLEHPAACWRAAMAPIAERLLAAQGEPPECGP